MSDSALRVFSYMPNPRVWKAQIAADLIGIELEVIGDKLTIADISYACDLAQFLRERDCATQLNELGLGVISAGGAETYPGAFGHLQSLCREPGFAKYLGDYADRLT